MEIRVKNPSEEMINTPHHIECKRLAELAVLEPKTPIEKYLEYFVRNSGSGGGEGR